MQPVSTAALSSVTTDLERVLELTDSIVSDLDRHVGAARTAFPDLDAQQVTDKLLAETSLLLLLVSRSHQASQLGEQVANLAAKVARHARHDRHLEMLAISPQSVVGLGFTHVVLQKLGLLDTVFDDAVTTALRSRYVNLADRPNFRHLELCWLRSVALSEEPDCKRLLESSVLTQPAHPIFMRREDAYAVTHAVMYASNFGLVALSASICVRLALFVDHAICWTLSEQDWDLLAEIVLVQRMVRLPESVYVRQAEVVLAGLFREHGGRIPGPNFSAPALAREAADLRAACLAMHQYHPTLVYGMLRLLEPTMAQCHADEARSGTPAVEINSRLIWLAHHLDISGLLEAVQLHEGSDDERVRETCSTATELIMQWVRARAYAHRPRQLHSG